MTFSVVMLRCDEDVTEEMCCEGKYFCEFRINRWKGKECPEGYNLNICNECPIAQTCTREKSIKKCDHKPIKVHQWSKPIRRRK